MSIRLVQFSVVVKGKDHNPSILNPDFLNIREIVPRDWKTREVVNVPPFSTVGYDNGVSLMVESNRLQISDQSVVDDPLGSPVPEIAQKYVQTLPHVQYTAVGINFHGLIHVPSPETYLKERFLKQGAWDTEDHSLDGVGLRLVYPVTAGRLILSLDAAQVEDAGDKKPAISASGNFHRDCEGYPNEDQVVGHLGHVEDDWGFYTRLLGDLIDIVEEKDNARHTS